MKSNPWAFLALLFVTLTATAADTHRSVQLTTTDGIIEGAISEDGKVRSFLGIPFAQPPVGELRWKAPQPVKPWTGVRKATEFGPRPMQARIFDDMVFRDAGPSEDCLYLNVWVPADAGDRKLPVMVWIYGGGLVAGGSSEPRQDGSALCQKGVIVVSMNYRLGIFGFFSHPELKAESPERASGNYGFMDQVAALQWVCKNIAAFGGDPDNVTIFGESAGSISVCTMMATPLARGLFHKAIGQSGGLFMQARPVPSLAEAERSGLDFARSRLGTTSLAELRSKSAQEILESTAQDPRLRFWAVADGYVLPEQPSAIFAQGAQAKVPLIAGWTRDEGFYDKSYFGQKEATAANFQEIAKTRFGERAQQFLAAYRVSTDAEARRAAADLAGDTFIAYSTWKWLELHRTTGNAPVYRYRFDETLPLGADAKPGTEAAAPHASDIEFTFLNLSARKAPWTPEKHRAAEVIASYWVNFAKTGNPNGQGLPKWPQYEESKGFPVMYLKAEASAAPDPHRTRYLFLDAI